MSDAPSRTSDRAPGFYWVKRDDAWLTAEWDPTRLGGVFWTGLQDAYPDTEFAEIGPKIEPPE